jgi:NNMT/PNMT/TEMT family
MVDTAVPTHNASAPWRDFASHDYWRHNYQKILPEDREIIQRVSSFLIRALGGRPSVERAIDVGSGTNLYPALLMLPWVEQILLSDYSESNVRWLSRHVLDDDAPWTWEPFWRELRAREGYNRIAEPRKQLREACTDQRERPGIERLSVFDLPSEQWQLGTMFFVAESITTDPGEFAEAIGCFVGALKPGSPFAAAFMSGSEGYPVGSITFPAVPITEADIAEHFAKLAVKGLSVKRLDTSDRVLDTPDRVRDGYEGMVLATGIANGRPAQH